MSWDQGKLNLTFSYAKSLGSYNVWRYDLSLRIHVVAL